MQDHAALSRPRDHASGSGHGTVAAYPRRVGGSDRGRAVPQARRAPDDHDDRAGKEKGGCEAGGGSAGATRGCAQAAGGGAADGVVNISNSRLAGLVTGRLQWRLDTRHNKWLGANKSASVRRRLASTTKKEHSHAQNEDQERREKAFPCSSRWHRQARPSLQASYPDQED